MKDRYSSAERLFDSLGGIDDRFIAEAQSYGGVRRAAPAAPAGQRTRRFALVAAVAALLVVSLCVLPLTLRTSMDGISPDSQTTAGQNGDTYDAPGDHDGAVDGYTRVSAVSTLLRAASTSGQHAPLDGQPRLEDGQARLIWRCDGQLYAVSLSAEELEWLVSTITSSRGGQPIEHSEQLWLCVGDGRVISPELRPGAGNVSMGKLFDYSAELELDASVINCLRGILEA